ncbi:hypothetical protein COO60DRAFT_1632820 [Scenedesmus sp. NREL 46B-D3]|nr:hypothetical protein COO60DRAFT_1632820 [Scenedesmus sp. NREL 46B-D3]
MARGQANAHQRQLIHSSAWVGVDNVVASDVKTSRKLLDSGPFSYCDVQDKDNMARIILENGITHVVHFATLLSGAARPASTAAQPAANVLDLAAAHGLSVYAPSTIAVFGSTTPRHNTPDDTLMRPATMYGITKASSGRAGAESVVAAGVHQELLGQYYHDRYGVDYRSLRYPGIVSANAPPGGGTTDYAVEIFSAALQTGHYNCFLDSDAALPMMYMPDCLEATWQVITAPKDHMKQTTYNVTAVSFTPAELAGAIRRRLPHFSISYSPDFRDNIAKTWPASIDDSAARRQWGWAPNFDLQALADDMLRRLAFSCDLM